MAILVKCDMPGCGRETSREFAIPVIIEGEMTSPHNGDTWPSRVAVDLCIHCGEMIFNLLTFDKDLTFSLVKKYFPHQTQNMDNITNLERRDIL